MKDRIPTYAGRVTLIPVTGQTNTYTLAMADSPTEAGTPLNKATLLSDATAAAVNSATGTTPDTPSDALNLLAVTLGGLSGSAKIETGSYTGDGTTGSSNRTTITFSFEPKLVFIQDASEQALGLPYVWGSAYMIVITRTTTLTAATASVSGNTLRFYGNSPENQLNKSSIVYNWVAIG